MSPRIPASLLVLAVSAASACADEGGPAQDGAAPAGAPAPAAPAKPADGEKWEKTSTGLEYQVLAAGKDGGISPKDGDTVVCSYKGWLESGKVFDESARHGGPARFPVGGLVPGWNEALKMMKVGAKWKLRLPPELGYGKQGAGADIPPNSVLYFELEIHDVVALPRFVRPDRDKQKVTASGLRYEVVREGAGEHPGANDVMELRYAFFTSGGKLIDCSESDGRSPIKAKTSDMALQFLREAPLLLKPGSRYRFEVPPELAFGSQARGPDLPPNSTLVWELELVRVIAPIPLPPFETVDESKFTKRESGLLMQVVKEGTGTAPRLGQTVRVHYAGWLTDGTSFDSSFGRGEPAEFQLGRVIAGWNEGLQQMKPGGVCRFVIPAKLAYGDQGQGDKIKPGSTLVFYVELLSVK